MENSLITESSDAPQEDHNALLSAFRTNSMLYVVFQI